MSLREHKLKVVPSRHYKAPDYKGDEIDWVEYIYRKDNPIPLPSGVRVTEISYEYVSKRLNGEAHPGFHSFRFITQDGRTRWVELKSVPIIWDGKSAALNFFTDITELKQYEERVRGSIRAH